MASSRFVASALLLLLGCAAFASASFELCDVSTTASSRAKAEIIQEDTDPSLLTVRLSLPLERPGDFTPTPTNFLKTFKLSAECSDLLFTGSVFTGPTGVDISVTGGAYADLYDSGYDFANTWKEVSTDSAWSYYRDDTPVTCSLMQFKTKKSIEAMISAGCLSYTGADATHFFYQSEFNLERWYQVQQTFTADGDILQQTRTTTRYISEYFSVQVRISDTVGVNDPSVSGEIVNGKAVIPSTNNALSGVTISQLDGSNLRQVVAKVTVLVNYPYNLRLSSAALPTGVASVGITACLPDESNSFAAFGDVCQQEVTITYDADACTASRTVALTAGLLKYECAPNTFEAGHCDVAYNSGTLKTFDELNPNAVVLSVTIDTAVECTYSGGTYTGTVTATAQFAKGLLGGETSWVHATGDPYLYYFGGSPNDKVYVDVTVTNDDNINDPTNIQSVDFTAVATVALSTPISGADQSLVSSTHTTSPGCGLSTTNADQYTGCLIVPVPTFPQDNRKYGVSVDVDLTVTLTVPAPTGVDKRSAASTSREVKLRLEASTEATFGSNTGSVTAGTSPATIAIAVIIAVVAVAAIGGAVLLAVVIRKSQTAAASV